MSEMGKKDNKAIFFTDDEQMGRLSEALVSLDVNLSELIRTCIDIFLPILLERPALIKIIPTLPQKRKGNNIRG